ncbi:hypothetical protein SAMN06295879_3035 [Agreia bicolorata]|uniref:Heparinase II/III-like protein n=1 Tax=Agreia bicolorata TaxID=110935 RepID=A0A1T4YFJ9_9MICO|nr:hypothetical protein [Agreia bicolorata]SKB00544.1 hypothetical protein SAMN06295879_3035 [Agreia bicolorata]
MSITSKTLLHMIGQDEALVDHDFVSALFQGALVQATELESTDVEDVASWGHRELMRAVLVLVATDIAGGGEEPSRWLQASERFVYALTGMQGVGGLFSSEGNLNSPPDTAFTINDLCSAVSLVDGADDSVRGRWSGIRQQLEGIALRAAPALATGGVHTPNHRWEVASALAGLNALWPDAKVRARAELWLAEGIDIDADGLYSERSGIYAAEVTNPSLLNIARDLDKPELRDVVLRNLRAYVALVEDDGEVENVHSRRQDQRLAYDVELFLTPLRQLAIEHSDAELAGLAAGIVSRGLRHPGRHLAELLRHPAIGRRLPLAVEAPLAHETFYEASKLLRVRRGSVSASLFAGSDFARTGHISSGLANSATLVRARRGSAVLRSVRLAPTFFSMGCIRPQSLDRIENGAVLRETRRSGYYEPLPVGSPRDLSEPVSEGRYFASMDFENRSVDAMALTTVVTATVDDRGVSLGFSFEGVATRYAVELVFDGELAVSGAEPLSGVDAGPGWWLRGGAAEVTGSGSGATIEAAGFDDVYPDFDEGEIFGYVGGNDDIPGTRLLLSGSTLTPSTLRLNLV